jgi:hypothetical protein
MICGRHKSAFSADFTNNLATSLLKTQIQNHTTCPTISDDNCLLYYFLYFLAYTSVRVQSGNQFVVQYLLN